jgi:hypothetical protein
MACLKVDGKKLSRKDRLAKFAIKGAITSGYDFRRYVGTESDGDVLHGILDKSFSTSAGETGLNLSNIGPLWNRGQEVPVLKDRDDTVTLILPILLVKKS